MKGAPASFEAGAPFMQEPEPEVPVFPDRTPPASAAPQSARHCAAHAVSAATVPTAGAPLSRDGGARPAIPAFGGILRGRIGRPKGLHGRPLLTRGHGGSACAGRPGCRGGTGGAASPAVPESCGGEESLRDRRSTPPPLSGGMRRGRLPAVAGGAGLVFSASAASGEGAREGGGSRAARRRARTDQYL